MTGVVPLDVVIVSYRCRDLVRECLRSLREHPPACEVTVSVVDNASGDGTVEVLREEFPDVWVHESATNLGFSAASNVAIRRGRSKYVLGLNPDTRVTPGALDSLLDLMEKRPEIGIAGCRLEREDSSFDHAAKRSFPTALSALGHFTGIGRWRHAPRRLGAYRAPSIAAGPVDAVNGAFMLIRRRALDEVGLFDEGYWMYMEDLDLCYRFAQAGWVTWYEPSVTVHHAKHGSSGPRRSVRLEYAFHYGMYRFYRKHYANQNSRLVNALVYVGIGAKLAASVARSAGARRALVRRRPAAARVGKTSATERRPPAAV